MAQFAKVPAIHKIPMRHVFAAALVAATALGAPISALASDATDIERVVVLGAIHDPDNARYVQAPVDKSVPALPVVYEHTQPAKAPSQDKATNGS